MSNQCDQKYYDVLILILPVLLLCLFNGNLGLRPGAIFDEGLRDVVLSPLLQLLQTGDEVPWNW
jgi:hypothetical protein